MKIFRFRGGIHPEGNKDPTACHPIARLPLPKRLYIPLQQHIGEPAAPEVKVGDHVLKGQRLARHQGDGGIAQVSRHQRTIPRCADRPSRKASISCTSGSQPSKRCGSSAMRSLACSSVRLSR